ncbi:hypothetical protein D9V41_06335 [Aeromicrobium phragmitis]|uniref:Flp pilus assembly protein RcpC/CpaB domain-containing protein n=1 Tax=Aeromicrobium phragmitis TaxID=2478914 RepID=A0A3L8PMP6_9ACTN|nr:RcpC/CpaB family pilus assembly protein [Aeromicrobium phragmitis]RLV56677.1 hypothetical protein D9V41_06335 [Aeromicrobium phragmitis]
MNRQIAAIGVAVVLAVLGIAAVVAYARGADERALAGTETVEVLRLTAPVEAKTPAAELADHVELDQIPRAALVEGALTSLEDVAGQVTSAALVPGDQLTAEKFTSTEQVEGGTSLPEGLQAIAFPLEPHRAVSGEVLAGDTIGIMASYHGRQVTANLANRVLVLSITPADGGSSTVTAAVTTEQAEKIIHAMEFGTVWLTKQNESTDVEGGRTITEGDIAP